MNVFTCPNCLPGTNRHKDWTRDPILFDDHGQPLCHTQAEEDELLDELAEADRLGLLTSGAPAIPAQLLDPNKPPF